MPDPKVIRQMFEEVAPRYDLLNRVLSFGIDRLWRREVVKVLDLRSEDRALDLCCGTGDLAIEINFKASCFACDFTWSMLKHAREKSNQVSKPLKLVAADTLSLPFPSNTFDAATIAFGIRNLSNINHGLSELYRVLKPGGNIAILEFSHPQHFWLKLPYKLYLNVIVPNIGKLLSHRRTAYQYLAESIIGFAKPDELNAIMIKNGFHNSQYKQLTGGIVAIHYGQKR